MSTSREDETSAAGDVYDFVIIGGGAVGSCALYFAALECAKRGGRSRCLLLEQFDWGHTRGSSHGHSRIIRKSYPEPEYAQFMDEAFDLWRDAESLSGTNLIRTVGGIDFGRSDSEIMGLLARTLAAQGIDHERLTAREAATRFPGFSLPDSFECVFCPETGVIDPEAAMAVMRDLAARSGRAHVRTGARVTRYSGLGNTRGGRGDRPVRVECDDGGSFLARRVIVCPGGWIGKHLDLLGAPTRPGSIRVTRMTYGFFDVPEGARRLYERPDRGGGHGRVFIRYSDDPDEFVYGFPINETPGKLKTAMHTSPHSVDLDDIHTTPDTDSIARVKEFIADHLAAGVGGQESKNEYGVCFYTVPEPDPDGSTFMIFDSLPHDPRVVVVGALHGQGFKMSNVLGRAAVEWARDGTPPARFDVRRFTMSRFLSDGGEKKSTRSRL